MFDKFNKLFENKDKIKSDLLDYKTDIYVSIYDAVLNHKKLADTKLKHQWKNIETKKSINIKKLCLIL